MRGGGPVVGRLCSTPPLCTPDRSVVCVTIRPLIIGVVTLRAGCANVTSFAHSIRAMTRSRAGERVVARSPRRARARVRRTIVACVPGIGTLQSVETRYSYANCQKEHEYYQSAPVSRQIVGQTRLPSALRHKAYFPYEWLCIRHTGPPDRYPPYGQQRRGELGVTPARSTPGPPMVASRGGLSAPCVPMACLHTGDHRCLPHPRTGDDGAGGTGGDAA